MFQLLPEPEWEATLEVDKMYYMTAMRCYTKAKEALKQVGNARRQFCELEWQEEEILEKYKGDQYDAGNELESIYIQMEGAEYEIGSAYGPYLQNIALTHMLSTAALEAHINKVALENLKEDDWGNFDKLSIKDKWLNLPEKLGKLRFDSGRQPFQDFSKMIKHRNKLVHYKEEKMDWKELGHRKPNLPKKLDMMDLRDARNSLMVTQKMILELADKIGGKHPGWLYPEYVNRPQEIVTNFFKIQIKPR